MTNELLFFVEVVVCFGGLLLVNRFLKKEGVIAWVAIASILANIVTAKTVNAFGMSLTLGTILFASNYLATDILTERYGREAAKKAVIIGLVGTVCFILCSQIALMYIPNEYDYAHDAMATLFTINLRISIASVIMYFVSNMADVYLYDKIRQKTNGEKKWLRNNVATILCNTLENFIFMFAAFLGMYTAKEVLIMAICTSIVEIVVGLLDTPFLYIATRKELVEEE